MGTAGSYYVYILVSPRHGTLYIGVSKNVLRLDQHRCGRGSDFVKKYDVLILFDPQCPSLKNRTLGSNSRRDIMSNNGPSFTKATYDGKRPRPEAPNPDRQAAAQEIANLEAAKSRSAHQEITRAGGLARWILGRYRKSPT
jgi:hypothetical protein